MTKRLLLAASAAALLAAFPATAALQQGASVPSLVAQGALNGRTINFNLQQELRKGPVVLYFFPKAFTPGCNLEAQAFAEAIDEFKAAGAQVVGMSGDPPTNQTSFGPVVVPVLPNSGMPRSRSTVAVPRWTTPSSMCTTW